MYHGRVIPAAILLGHQDRVAQLRGRAPRRSRPRSYRRPVPRPASSELAAAPRVPGRVRVRDDQKLILVTSTWGPGSLLGQAPGLLPGLLAELPASRYRVAASLHPDAWHWHGPWQVRAWLPTACAPA